MKVSRTYNLALEHQEQKALIEWIELCRNSIPELQNIFAIPNGGKRGKAESLRLKVEGVSAGVPDLYIPAWRLWIEFKRVKGGTVSPDQEDWHEYLRSIGDLVVVAYGCDDAKKNTLKIKNSWHERK